MANGRHKAVCCGKGHHVGFREQLTKQLRRAVPDLHEGTATTGYGKKRGSGNTKLQYVSSELAHLVSDLIGKGAKNKRLPGFWSLTSPAFRRGLLAGLLDTDGSLTHDKNGRFTITYTTASELLSSQLAMLCTSLGIRTGVSTYTKKRDGKIDGPYFHVTLWSVDVKAIAPGLTFFVEKKEKVREALLQKEFGNSPTLAKLDLVPVSRSLLKALRKIGTKALGSTLYTGLAKSDNSDHCYLSRYYAERLINNHEEAVLAHEHGPRWVAVVRNTGIQWDRIEDVELHVRRQTAYDLTVPGPYTFMTDQQLVVWDTVALMVPLSKESVEEVKSVMPSARPTSAASGDVLFTPTNESALGLYRSTLSRDKRNIRFKSQAEAEKAFEKGKINLDSVVTIGKIPTTLGRARIAKVVPEAFKKGGTYRPDKAF